MKAPRPPAALTAEETAAVRSWVIHEDAHVLVLNKPAGLSSQGGRVQAHTLDDLLWAFARSNGKRPDLVHRLDRDTSGVILAAKTKPAAGFLGKAIQSRRLKKTYLALVSAAPEPRTGRIDTPLLRQEIGRESHMRVAAPDEPGAQASTSLYRTLSATADAALVELSPLTGRMHQLRVHMASIGRALVGDARYGGALTLAGAPAPRLMLHASRLTFPHPEGGERTVQALPPPDFVRLADAAGLGTQGLT
ncbi:MAG: RluA family pseudouridine synthase [Alphaproteobacteria bacterium]|nr:RluA family pseudouridine synthase [Alphaproteobacteria bacterium]MBU1526504.1 RluA family pseudouridine synthase [Alphaproteobacteria bacterium]MBU2116809.1 RluA family pseudouridine synthase [Alphaproteobacteria bacterium]MBU2350278.1 RluA family pseudouridine synthase [Alphaproteobacteria bacterium]MBU2381258.1 RluA family pseudouridine synthase [Alphaproteobacteria bacterium]